MFHAGKRVALGLIATLAVVAIPFGTYATQRPTDQIVYVGSTQVIDGSFIKAGNVIDIDGEIQGDVVVAGNSVTINGYVAGDVFAAANTIRINGEVAGSVRVAGSAVEINGTVAHNVWALGSNIRVGETGSVGWDVMAAGGSVELRGPVNGQVMVGTGSLLVASDIGKSVYAFLDTEGAIALQANAVIQGDLEYHAANDTQLVTAPGFQVLGQTTHKQLQVPDIESGKALVALFALFKLISFLGAVLIGLVLALWVPKVFTGITTKALQRPAASLGWGFAFFILMPVAAGLLMVTVIGLPFGIILIALYAVMLYLVTIFSAHMTGSWLLAKLSKKSDQKKQPRVFWVFFLGLVVLTAISFIPVLGGLINFIILLFALGGLWQFKQEVLKKFR